MSTPQSLIPEEQLTQAEQAFLEAFERRYVPSEGNDTEPTSAENMQEPTSDDSAASGGVPAEGQVASPESEQQQPEPEPTEQPSAQGEPTGEEPAQSEPAFTFAGIDYSPDQLARAVQIHDWFGRLNNDQIQAIDLLLSGQYRLAPAQEAAPISPSTPQQSPPAPASPASTTGTGQSPDFSAAGDWLDPRAEAEITALRNQISELQTNFQTQLQQNLGPVVQSQQQQALNQQLEIINSTAKNFATKYNLNDEQVDAVIRSVNEAQIIRDLRARHNGDTGAAFNQALEMMFWTSPALRDPYIQSSQTAALTDAQEQERADTLKKQQLTALANSGGSVPRRDPVPSNKEDRYVAMTEEIRSAMNGQ